jgi:hypothetical protein
MNSELQVGTELRITIVCHNISSAEIASTLPIAQRDMVNFLEFRDNLPSPAGPKNFAVDQTNGRYIAFLDSDDSYDSGALREWSARAERRQLDAVIPPERHAAGGTIRTPVVRPFRSRNLNPLRDRLSYRTAPLGLIRRSTLAESRLVFAGGVRNGSDQIFGLKLWFDSKKIEFARGGPGYIVGADAQTRVTTQLQALGSELKATSDLFDDSWFSAQQLSSRRAIAVKSVRILFFGAVARRFETDSWTAESHREAADFLRLAARVAPGYTRTLSIADVELCRAVLDEGSLSATLAALSVRRRAFGTPATVLTPRIWELLAIDAPIRFMFASLLH